MSLLFSLMLLSASPIQLYPCLSPHSVTEAIAFYELFPTTDQGQRALSRAAGLLGTPKEALALLVPYIHPVQGISQELSEQEMLLIESLASHLPNRKLKGYHVTSEEEVLALPSEEIDLAKALILSQMGGQPQGEKQMRSYSALLDLMALQILAHLSKNASLMEKLQEMNRFIFEEMHFKFPAHSVYVENIDRFTFLPSVMDNHLGVCLGVTALYLALAQRIDLPLEIITPPGHIYVRCRIGDKSVNIETTARGIHLSDETYLSLQNPTLEQRTLKEVIGMTHVNQASTYLYKADYAKAMHAYEKAYPYLPEDPLIKELLGYSYLFMEKKEAGEALLKSVGKGVHAIAEDYLAGKVGLDGIEAVFIQVDESYSSITSKQKKLIKVTEKYPCFREGWHQLAVTWIQLGHTKEAIAALTRCYQIDATDPITAYYLAVLHGQRQDFHGSWRYLREAERLTSEKNFFPKALRELRRELMQVSPTRDDYACITTTEMSS